MKKRGQILNAKQYHTFCLPPFFEILILVRSLQQLTVMISFENAFYCRSRRTGLRV